MGCQLFCWATGTKPTGPGLWPGKRDSHIGFEAGVLVFCRHSFVHRRHGWTMSKAVLVTFPATGPTGVREGRVERGVEEVGVLPDRC